VCADRHKSFKLRLPSIRRDIRRNSMPGGRKDEENPPLTAATMLEEAVPLTRLHMAGDSVTQPPPPPQIHTPFMSLTPPPKRPLDREASDVSRISQWSNDAMVAAGMHSEDLVSFLFFTSVRRRIGARTKPMQSPLTSEVALVATGNTLLVVLCTVLERTQAGWDSLFYSSHFSLNRSCKLGCYASGRPAIILQVIVLQANNVNMKFYQLSPPDNHIGSLLQ
jgi:hypothetical protein